MTTPPPSAADQPPPHSSPNVPADSTTVAGAPIAPRRWPLYVVIGAALAAVTAVVLAITLPTRTYEVGGTLTLTDTGGLSSRSLSSGIVTSPTDTVLGTDRYKCWGHRGYNDIREGAEVKVYDDKGTLVGAGRLGPGRSGPGASSALANTSCLFPIEVAEIPAGARFYQVEVTHRGKVTIDGEPGPRDEGKLFAFVELGD